MSTKQDDAYMRLALEQARLAFDDGEVPVGAVLVRDGQVIAVGRNRREQLKNTLAHAEIEAISGGSAALGGWRLLNCTLYVTLEPCPMCAGAIQNARIARLVYGCPDVNNGACGSVCSMNDIFYNHKVETEGGVLAAESRALLDRFFSDLRKRRKAEKAVAGSGQTAE